MNKGNNNIPSGLSFIDKYNPFLENKEELRDKIEESDILLGSKIYLIKKLKEYSNNDNNNLKNDLNSAEIKNIKELIKKYDILENKYQLFTEKLHNNYSNLVKIIRKKGYIYRKYLYGNIIQDYIVPDKKIVDVKANKYISEIDNYLNNIDIEKLNSINIDSYLDKKEKIIKEIDSAIGIITKNIGYININEILDFNVLEKLYIRLAEEYIKNKGKYEKLNQVDLFKKLLENIKISDEEIEIFGDLGIIIENNPEIFFLKQKLKKHKKYKKYSEKLKNEGLEEENIKTILYGINKYLIDKTFTLEGKKIKFTKEFIKKNREFFIENIKKYLIFLMNIESYGGENVENNKSSAKGPLQWIDGFKNGKKYKNLSRKGRYAKYSSFETALRRADKFYNNGKYTNFNSSNTPLYIKNAWKNNGKLNLDFFGTDKQISLWFIDIIMRSGKAKEYLMGVMLGNTWSIKKLYEDIHHTHFKKGSKIEKVINKNLIYINRIK